MPPFSLLQRFYLTSLDLPVSDPGVDGAGASGIACVSDSDKLAGMLSWDPPKDRPSLFIATWSLSESPIAFRNRILDHSNRFDYFLIAYQDRFQQIDNLQFFRAWAGQHTEVAWHESKITHMPGNRYLFGIRRDRQ